VGSDLSHREKTLLTLLGKTPDISYEELKKATGYQWESTISKKKKILEAMGYIRGPYYHMNLHAVGENELFDIYALVSLDTSDYDLVFRMIKAIGCWKWIFPAIQGDRFFVYFQANYYSQISRLLGLLKRAGIIDYEFYSSQNRWIVQNPDFFGDDLLRYDTLFLEGQLPSLHYPPTPRLYWRQLDIRMMGYLQVRSLDVNFIQSFEEHYFRYSWKKDQIKYSIRKLIKNGIAERKHFNISPYPREECFSFLLLITTTENTATERVMKNLGSGCRIYKAYTLAGNTGIMLSWASARNIPLFLGALEDRDDVWVRAYQLKTHTTPYMIKQSFDIRNFNLENQRWIFPYHEYEQTIMEYLEGYQK
jgi:DNA-binding Lrp family transcriptional regulator